MLRIVEKQKRNKFWKLNLPAWLFACRMMWREKGRRWGHDRTIIKPFNRKSNSLSNRIEIFPE
jgi:hypothetical protein